VRGRRRLDKAGDWRIDIVAQPGAELETALEAYQAVDTQSWKQPEPCLDFIPELVRLATELPPNATRCPVENFYIFLCNSRKSVENFYTSLPRRSDNSTQVFVFKRLFVIFRGWHRICLL
jgi:hypothetical protein